MRIVEEQETAGRTGGGGEARVLPFGPVECRNPQRRDADSVAMNGIGYLLYCGFVCGCQAKVPEPVLSPNARVCAGARYSNNL